jgi:hypothetical protein
LGLFDLAIGPDSEMLDEVFTAVRFDQLNQTHFVVVGCMRTDRGRQLMAMRLSGLASIM